MYSKELMSQVAKSIAKKRKMSEGGEVEDDNSENSNVVEQQEKSSFSDDTGVGGSDALVKALSDQLSGMAYGGLVEEGDNTEPGMAETVPTQTPESKLSSSDLSEGAKKAIEEKKKRRRF